MNHGHFVLAKICNVKVNEFSIGFGKEIWHKQGKETKYAIRLIPLGGFVSMEGEEERSENSKSFSKASIPKRIAIVSAGAIVNIIFAIIVYFILTLIVGTKINNSTFMDRIINGGNLTKEFIISIADSLKQLFTGKVGVDQMMGPVGISEMISKTSGIFEFFEKRR